jgi:metal-responsive CopG/Arc/MetJ family transcriptional regulator
MMAGAVKITISLPQDLAAEAEEIARSEGKTLSGVVQDALREVRARRLKIEFREVQGFWAAKAKAKGILTERELDRILRK